MSTKTAEENEILLKIAWLVGYTRTLRARGSTQSLEGLEQEWKIWLINFDECYRYAQERKISLGRYKDHIIEIADNLSSASQWIRVRKEQGVQETNIVWLLDTADNLDRIFKECGVPAIVRPATQLIYITVRKVSSMLSKSESQTANRLPSSKQPLRLPSNVSANPGGTIEIIHVTHNIYQDDKYGMQIDIKGAVMNLKGRRCAVAAFFLFSSSRKLVQDLNGLFCLGQNAVAYVDLVPEHNSTTFTAKLFMPYAELHLSIDATHNLSVRGALFEYTTFTIVAKSKLIEFTLAPK